MRDKLSDLLDNLNGETPDEVIAHLVAAEQDMVKAQQLPEAERAEANAREHDETARKLEAGEVFTDGWKPAIDDPVHYRSMAEMRRDDAAGHRRAADTPPGDDLCAAMVPMRIECLRRKWIKVCWRAGKLRLTGRLEMHSTREVLTGRQVIECDSWSEFERDGRGADGRDIWVLRHRDDRGAYGKGAWRGIEVEATADWTEDDDWRAWIAREVLGSDAAAISAHAAAGGAGRKAAKQAERTPDVKAAARGRKTGPKTGRTRQATDNIKSDLRSKTITPEQLVGDSADVIPLKVLAHRYGDLGITAISTAIRIALTEIAAEDAPAARIAHNRAQSRKTAQTEK